jgi:hypothetical protein
MVTILFTACNPAYHGIKKNFLKKRADSSLLPGFVERPQGIFVPHNPCSYRWSVSEPRVQKDSCFNPVSFATGQVLQIQVRSKSIQKKLFPVKQ